jgi:hypothetical protein
MKKFFIAAAIVGTVTAVVIVYLQQLSTGKYLEDPTMDVWG